MRATQLLRSANGSERARPLAGELRYVRSPGHSHWHYQGFMRYELRRAVDGRLIARDRKSGFCLGDRYDANPTRRLAHEPPLPAFATDCGRGQPGLRALREGISVGHGDDYSPRLHRQSIDLTGLKPGRYLLIHRANPDRRLAESDHANNASSALISLAWPRGPTRSPRIAVLARCPQTQRCPLATATTAPSTRPTTSGDSGPCRCAARAMPRRSRARLDPTRPVRPRSAAR